MNDPKTIQRISRAKASVDPRLCMVIFVKGPLRNHAERLASLWKCLLLTSAGKSLARYRFWNETQWRPLSPPQLAQEFGAAFGFPSDLNVEWGVQISAANADGPDSETFIDILDLVPILGNERLSYIQIRFQENSKASEFALFANWVVNNFPVWWGTAGWYFHHSAGQNHTAYKKIAAKSKRHWGIQILDLTALQWEGLRGLPGVNWLTLIGNDFALERGLDMSTLVEQTTSLASGVFCRTGEFGLVIAAGSRPLQGDVNTGESISTYSEVANLLKPLLLAKHAPLSGPFENADVMNAWLRRFDNPQAWVECDISA
jgi:hypothetical protein